MSPLTTTGWYEVHTVQTTQTQTQTQSSECGHPPASQHRSSLVILLVLCLYSRPRLRGVNSIGSVQHSTCSAQPSCAVHFTLVHAQMVCWPAGPVSAAQKHAGMARQAGYPLVWYLSSALSAGWRLKSGDGSTAAPFWIPSLPE